MYLRPTGTRPPPKESNVMHLMRSIETANVVQEQQGRAEWVRTVRKDSPPGSLEEYL
jgi:hypothetical protein